MNFTLKQLRYVEASGRLGSIANAATELNISQSSITAAIGALESQLGFDLFKRTPAKGIRVTPAGQKALRLIRAFIIQSRHFETEMISIGGATTGNLRVSCYATAAPSFLPPILKSFKVSHPSTSITLLEGNMEATLAYLVNGEADLAFAYDLMTDTRHDFTPLFGAPPHALLAADDPLTKNESVSLFELIDRPMVMLDLPRTRDYFSSIFEPLGLQPNVAHSTRSAEIVRALVSGGHGYSIMNICPPGYRHADSPVCAMPIRDGLQVPVFGIMTPSGLRQPNIVQAFIDQCVGLAAKGSFDEIIVKQPDSSTTK
ncbi:LysR family transcriptional regulator [Planktotalea sp.]|uniref:LysR family transcriptional regulator n=1 Tax=Planktotalea sp. TaxID=2029877 RepID=UPI003D6C6310